MFIQIYSKGMFVLSKKISTILQNGRLKIIGLMGKTKSKQTTEKL